MSWGRADGWYQVRYGELSSRAYGSPQNRLRVFVLAVRPGLPLPTFPKPTHANPKARPEPGEREREPSPSEYVPPAVGSARRPAKGTGPRRAVTARDAIGDFPRMSPHCRANDSVRLRPPREVRPPRRVPERVPLQPAAHELPACGAAAEEGQPPRRVVPLYRAAVGRRSPSVRWLGGAADGRIDAAPLRFNVRGPGPQDRLDPHGHVPTIMGSPWPGGKARGTVHWDQNRVLSVAERRRVQGLPDNYILRGSVAEVGPRGGQLTLEKPDARQHGRRAHR